MHQVDDPRWDAPKPLTLFDAQKEEPGPRRLERQAEQ